MRPLSVEFSRLVQLGEFALGIELGEKRERGHADALSYDAERHAHERLGITQPGNGGGLEVGAKPADDPIVGKGQRQGQHDGDRQPDEQAKPGMPQVEIGVETHAHRGGSIDLEEEIADQRSDEDAHGKAGHADARGEEPAAQNNHDVVDHRREGGDQEASLGVLDGGEDAALVEAELGWKHQAGEEDDPGFLRGPEIRGR